jgi:hypothetical protein
VNSALRSLKSLTLLVSHDALLKKPSDAKVAMPRPNILMVICFDLRVCAAVSHNAAVKINRDSNMAIVVRLRILCPSS